MFSFSFHSKKKPTGKSNPMNPRPTRARLERRNAAKNIDYDALASPSDSHSAPHTAASTAPSSPEAVRGTRSLDLSRSYAQQTSFRIGGSDEGEIDLLYRSIGISGPEDFAISPAAWEASRAHRSSSDLLPRSRLSLAMTQESRTLSGPATASEVHEDSSSCHIGGIKGVRLPTLAPAESVMPISTELAPPTAGEFRNSMAWVREHGTVRKIWAREGGINGARPPTLTPPSIMTQPAPGTMLKSGMDPSPSSVLTPPPSILLPELEKVGSTWDLVRSFAPDDANRRSFGSEGEEEDDDEEEEEEEEGVIVRWGEEASEDVTSMSNDDDSSSTTTVAMFVISPNGRFKRNIQSWLRGHLLGSGSFGTVYEGISDNGFFFAVKEVSLLDQGSNAQQCIQQLEQEIALLSQFEHENIVQYYGTDKEEANLFIFLELVTQGSLAKLYQQYRLQDSQVSAYTIQILKGLVYLHERNVVHRDIKCANILVDVNGSVKLADFGLAKQITKINMLKSCKGSVYWMAPEVVRAKGPYGPAADIWSLGCTVLEMLTQKVPYPDLEWQRVLFMVGRGEKPPIPNSLSRDARDFITQCVQSNPADRPTAAQLLEHPFVRRSLPFLGTGSDYASSPGNNRWN